MTRPPETFEGFSQRYKDLPDYILQITRDIWEGRGIGLLRDLYAADIPVRFPSGAALGNRATIEGTMATLAEFPDRTLYGQDVVWCGNRADGYLSSHRIASTGTHTGRGPFSHVLGAVTGRPFRIRAIADCAARDGAIYDEWLIRDTGALVRQLGGEPEAYARDLVAAEGGPDRAVRPLTPLNDVPGTYAADATPRGNAAEWGERYADILRAIMAHDFDVIPREYDRACTIEAPGGHAAGMDGISWEAADRFWLPLRSSFPGAAFAVHHVIGREDAMLGPRAAVRWSLWGAHDGWGAYGAPTGADIHVMGISHATFGPWGLRHETTLVDEVAVWKQIHLARMDAERPREVMGQAVGEAESEGL